jgi:hypothetical protein
LEINDEFICRVSEIFLSKLAKYNNKKKTKLDDVIAISNFCSPASSEKTNSPAAKEQTAKMINIMQNLLIFKLFLFSEVLIF